MSGGAGAAFGGVFDAAEAVLPAFGHAVAVFGRDEAHGAVDEGEAGAGGFGFEAVLDVVVCGVGHGHGAAEFEEGGGFDDLHVAPEVAVGVPAGVAQVAVPAPAGPGFDCHGEWRAIGHDAAGAEFFQQGGEDDVGRRRDEDVLADVEGDDGFGGERFGGHGEPRVGERGGQFLEMRGGGSAAVSCC